MGALFTCSIDDGHPSDMRMAELLSKHGLKGTFFVPIKNREGPDVLLPAQIREIGREFEIGSHTYDHCYLNSIDGTEASYQVAEGKQRLEDILGDEVNGFCYPGGKYLQKHVALIQSAGFRYARTIKNFRFDAGSNPYEIPTTIQFYPHSRSVYLRNFVSGGDWPARLSGLRVTLRQENWMDRLYALFDHARQYQSLFHLWCHTNDIDNLSAWNEMEQFLAYAAARVTVPNRLENRQVAERFFPEEKGK